jgi:adenylate cyclase
MRRLSLLSARLHAQHPGRKWIAAAVLAIVATGLALAAKHLPGSRETLAQFDDLCYDAFYRQRPIEDRTNGPIVMVVVDDRTLADLTKANLYWPYPRDIWADLIQYLDDCGAKGIGFDILFSEPSAYGKYNAGDDESLASAVNMSRAPVAMAMQATPDGKPGPFALKIKKNKLHLAAVNLTTDKTLRTYSPTIYSQPSLATSLTQLSGGPQRPWASDTFRLHFYGPHESADGRRTYRYLSLANVKATIDAGGITADAKTTAATGINPAMFKDKIVLVGYIATATYDLKSSPLSALYPGIESHATAIDNLLADQYVHPADTWVSLLVCFAGAFTAAILVLLPRKAVIKLIGAVAAAAVLIVVLLAVFVGQTIHWVPASGPVAALLVSTICAFTWSYYTEDRARRHIIQAFSQHVSPAVVAEIEKDPSRIRLGGIRLVMTVMFTDIEGFTGLTERIKNDEALTATLNYYFDQMSPLILEQNGTIDKYIGDAIMSFWNAPLNQPDHAYRACRAALAMHQREQEIRPELEQRGAGNCITRIGINSGPMVVGDMGSNQRFNYTVLGDSVNLGSRLEGANKIYGSRILMAQATAEIVQDKFIVRKLDLLRVKGKKQPIWVYELLGEKGKTQGEPDLVRRTQLYEAALAHCHQQRWDDCEAVLNELLAEYPEDAPAAKLLARVKDLRQDPPPPDWDGVYVAEFK